MTQFRSNLVAFARLWEGVLQPASDTPPDDRPPVHDRAAAPRSAGPERSSGSGWALPVGFQPVAPADSVHAARPPGIGIHKDYQRATISTALFKAMGEPERIFVALYPATKELLVCVPPTVAIIERRLPMHQLTKGHHVSKSVAHVVKVLGLDPGFYEATDAGDGTWRIKLEAAA
jgi:hypothetical protein